MPSSRLPVEIRNDIARLEIAGEHSAGAVRAARQALAPALGRRHHRRRPPTPRSRCWPRPIISARALGPFADVRLRRSRLARQAVSQFIEQRLPMLILADVGNVAEAREPLTRWIEDGGVLVRFAGPRLAAGDDDLVPVQLRRGGRMLGGSLSWDQPQQLAAFPRESPFFGMAVPTDVTVSRQVLAEPDATLNERTWATLADGTPLVTAQRRGKGLIVLFHVTADTRWSDLPLSGTFVEMLKRIVALVRLDRRHRRQRHRPRRARSGGADPRARRLRRVRAAAADRAAGAGRLRRARHRRSSARLLWAARGTAGGEHAGARRPARRRSMSRRSMPAARPTA